MSALFDDIAAADAARHPGTARSDTRGATRQALR